MFHATNSRIAASVAIGMSSASGASTSMIASRVAAWTMPATGVRAPLRMLVTVRAIVPVAAMPPKSGETTLAMPCAISSWFGSWRSRIIPSATRAHSSDSIAPSSAIEIVGPTRFCAVCQSKAGSANGGSPWGMPPKRLPMVSTCSPNTATATTPSTSTAIVPGTRAIQRRQRAWFGRYDFGHITTIASDTTPSHSAAQLTVCRCDHSVPSCEKKFDGIFGIDSPRKSFSCCSPMITAMPLVKPVTIDTGM